MVYLSTRFLFSAFYLSIRASYLMAQCCPGDTTCSYCWMCKGSALGNCWERATNEIDNCKSISDGQLGDAIDCFCTGYARLAQCWMAGRCCSEVKPLLAAATNFCNLGTHHLTRTSKDLFHQAFLDAENARSTIYHNDIGTDVPKLNVYIQARTEDFTESVSHYTRNVTVHAKQSNNYADNLKGHAGNQNAQGKDNTNYNNNDNTHYKSEHKTTYESKHKTNYESKSETETWENKNSASRLQRTTPPEKPETQGQHSETHKPTTNHESKMHGWSSNNKIYHKAKCSRQKSKCQAHIASQYHKARMHKSSQTHVKRSPSTLSQPPSHSFKYDVWKQNSARCGLDFQGVPYPTEIPQTVAREFAKF